LGNIKRGGILPEGKSTVKKSVTLSDAKPLWGTHTAREGRAGDFLSREPGEKKCT